MTLASLASSEASAFKHAHLSFWLQVASQIVGEAVLPWESPFEAKLCKLWAMQEPGMSLLSHNPANLPAMAKFLDCCNPVTENWSLPPMTQMKTMQYSDG
jgi:hypothetical protein